MELGIMLIWLLLILIAAFSLLFLVNSTHKNHEKLNLPSGPKGLPLIGNIHQFDPTNPHLYFSKLARTYGPIISLQFGVRPAVVVQSASLAKEVLKTQDHNFCTRPALTGQQRLSYNGLDLGFATYNDYYREMRKICVIHLFSSKKVQSSSHIRKEEVSRMIQKVSSLSSGSKVVNLSELLVALTSSLICRVALGRRYEDEDVERSRFHSMANEVQAMWSAFFFADYIPHFGGWIDKLTGLYSRLEKVFKDMDQFCTEVINDHLDPNRPKDEYEDIVDVLLHLRKERNISFELTLDNIKALLLDIVVGGTDTSAAMVVWIMTELIKNPSVMKKAQEELRTLIRYKSYVDEDDVQKLPYLKAIVKETFRVHPAVPLLIVREAIKECNIQGYDIVPKSLVFVNVWAIGRDPKVWDNPDTFMPERFLESSVDFKGQNFELIPFGAGRRICPGMPLGLANLEVALANLLYSFDWELPVGMKKEDIDIDVIPGITMHKKTPLCLVAKKCSLI